MQHAIQRLHACHLALRRRAHCRWVWVLDPIDGTKSFITGKPLFGTLIALLHNGVPVLGVIDQCVLKERWVGEMHDDVLQTTLNGEIASTRGAEKLSEAMMYATTPHMFGAGYEEEHYTKVQMAVKRALYGADCKKTLTDYALTLSLSLIVLSAFH